jgi:flagellin
MSRINSNVQSLIAQRVLGQNNLSLSKALERLSTGLRINRGKDDPAGLIASENLRSELKAIDAAITNSNRAEQVVNIAEGGLQEISGILTEIQGLITATANTAGLSEEEREANQLQIDSLIQTIDRIASATSFQGTKLLNGNYAYQVSGVAAGVADYRINSAKFNQSSLDVNVLVTQSAQQGGLFLSMGATTLDLGSGLSFVIEVGGTLGTRELTFTSSQSLTTIQAAINTFTEVTGVEAVVSGTGLTLHSSDFGSKEFVSVTVKDDGEIGTANNIGVYNLTSNDFNTVITGSHTDYDSTEALNGIKDDGLDVKATINGINATSTGKDIRINTDFLDVAMTLTTTQSQSLGNVGSGSAPAFTITGGGADFQLAANVDIAGKVSIGLMDVATRNLGTSGFGFLDDLANGKALNVVDGDLNAAQKVVDESIQQISSLRGRLGAFQKNTIGATIRSLSISFENTTAAESTIRDADFAAETAELTRSQILTQSSTQILALANQQPQTVLGLLG